MLKNLQSKLPIATMLLTDGDRDVVQLLERNCQRNNLTDNDDAVNGVAVECRQFAWGKEQAEDLLQHDRGFDLILGADLVYGRNDDRASSSVVDLFDSIRVLLGTKDASAFYLGFTRRDLPIAVVLEAANERGLIWELVQDYVYDIFDSNTDGQTCFWRDAIYVFRRGDGLAQSLEQMKEDREATGPL